MTDSNIKKEVMLRVRFIHLAKKALRPFAIEILVSAVALFTVGRFVFVAKVFENAPSVSRLQEFAMFFLRAFTHTEFNVQLLVLALAVGGVLAIKDFVKTLSMLKRMKLSRV